MGRASRRKREKQFKAEEIAKHYTETPAVRYPVRPRPATGSTDSERLLARLAKSTFLSMWSYPNVTRRESRGTSFQAKEVADLLVVFENEVVIFSDKDCEYPNTGNEHLDWCRWYRKAVEKSADQLWGAERQLRAHPDNVFIDKQATIALPIELPPHNRIYFHRVLVAHGASERCRQANGGSGSLAIEPGITGASHVKAPADGGKCFTIGRLHESKPFIHVFDDTSLNLVLEYLDTVSDFIDYLTKREAFLLSGTASSAAGEEALLGLYVARLNEKGEHDFVLLEGTGTPGVLREDLWHGFHRSGVFERKREADKVSYMWDHFIERFTHHYMEGTSQHLTDGESEGFGFEQVLRLFARENRMRRRALAQTLVDMKRTTPEDQRRIRIVPPSRKGDPYWVLVLIPYHYNLDFSQKPSYDEYRRVRQEYLHFCLLVTKARYPAAVDVVGFATESGIENHGSEDAAYLDAREWTAEKQREAEKLSRDLAILVRPNQLLVRMREYPDGQG